MKATIARGQRGFTLIYVAVLIVAFFLFAALAIDLGVAYTARTSAQHAADAAALAGAYTFVTQPLLTGGERVQAAFEDGSTVAGTYKVIGLPVKIANSANSSEACDSSPDNLICVDEGKRRVSAVVAAPIQTYFGRLFTDLLRVRVIAHAEAGTNAAGDRCIKPMYISNDAISNVPLGGGKHPKAEDYHTKCVTASGGASPSTIFDGAGNLTEYAKNYIASQSSFTSYINDPLSCTGVGCPISLFTNDNSPNPSQVGIVDFSAGQGNGAVDDALVKCSMERCLQECASPKPIFKCGDAVVGLKTGATWGQLEPLDGFTGNGSSKYVDSGAYDNGGSSTEKTSPAIVTVLVWDCTQSIQNGTQGEVALPDTPTIKGIAQMFINKVDQKTTNAFLVGAGPCESGSSSSGPGARPVRLVNK